VKIRPVGAELFHADGRTDISYLSLFTILRKRLKSASFTCRPTRWTRFISHHAATTPGMTLLSPEILRFTVGSVWRKRAKQSPFQTGRVNGLAKKCRPIGCYVWKSLYGEGTMDRCPQTHDFLNDVPGWSYSQPSACFFPWMVSMAEPTAKLVLCFFLWMVSLAETTANLVLCAFPLRVSLAETRANLVLCFFPWMVSLTEPIATQCYVVSHEWCPWLNLQPN